MSYCMICVQPYDNRDGTIGHPLCVAEEELVQTRARLEQQVEELEAKVENFRDRILISYDEFFGGGYL